MRFRIAFALFLLSTSLAHGASAFKGRLEWLHKVEMRVVESGVVEEVGVTAGQHVKKGDLLLRMDQRESKANLLEARARVSRAQVGTEKAERELARTQELFDRGLIAEEELRDAELGRAAAVAEAESAKAAEAAAQVALERTELHAPFDGIVVARHVWNGEVVYKTLQQKPLIVLAPDDRMLARVLVTADVLRRYPPGRPARVNLFGEMREAKVYALGVEAARVEVQGAVYELDVVFERRPDELLRPSEVVQVVLPLGADPGIGTQVSDPAMRRLYQARDRIEAQFLRDFLDRHLVSATILGDYLAGAAGDLPLNIYPTVWVLEDEELPRAEELLARFLDQPRMEPGPPWICPGCGERVEAAFDLCWNCGRHRD